MSIPTPYTLPVRSREATGEDSFGNPTYGWVERSWGVHFIAPGDSMEAAMPNRDFSRIEHVVGAPPSPDTPGEDDEVQVDGEWFQVDGAPDDFTRGPWVNPVAGVVVALTRSEG